MLVVVMMAAVMVVVCAHVDLNVRERESVCACVRAKYEQVV